MKEVILTPDENPVYDIFTDDTIPVSVRGRMAYEQLKSRFDTLKRWGAVQ